MELSIPAAKTLSLQILKKAGYSDLHSKAITDVLLQAQIDDCHSHGLYRLLNCIHSLNQGTVSAYAMPKFNVISHAITQIDAKRGMAPLTLQQGIPYLINQAKQQGIALLAINNSVHTTALWYEIELLTQANLVAFACTSNHAWVVPEGGKIPLFGTNPLAFGWPRPNHQHPFIFDFSTTAMARGEIELYRKRGESLPDGCGVDGHGKPTNDPATILDQGAMKTFGAYKGSALAAMVELLAGPLIGDVLSLEAQRVDGGLGGSPLGGEFILAMSPEKILGPSAVHYFEKAEELFTGYKQQDIRLPSARRYQARERNLEAGTVQIQDRIYTELMEYLSKTELTA